MKLNLLDGIQVKNKIAELDKQISDLQKYVLCLYQNTPRGKDQTIHSLHAIIGSYHNQYMDSIRLQFSSAEDFIEKWKEGFHNKILELISLKKFYPYLSYGNELWGSQYTLLKLMKEDNKFNTYVHLFLQRTFYREYNARTREKPIDNVWELWFGNQLCYGLFITPIFENGNWRTSKSELRRASYNYWTIEHVIKTGLIIPENNNLNKFSAINELLNFYDNTLKRLSCSNYEKQIMEYYVAFLQQHEQPLTIPFLIPELRFGGKEKKHLYRLDFAIFNPYNMKFTGIEISPSSSHMSVTKISNRTQSEVNQELKSKWEKEMDKRNKYWEQYNINVVTFTDSMLQDIDKCFNKIKELLLAENQTVLLDNNAQMKLDSIAL